DGIPEIITAPGHNHEPTVEVWSLANVAPATPPTLVQSFDAYGTKQKVGVMVALGDVNGDGRNDLVTAPSQGPSEIRVFINQSATTPATPFVANVFGRFLAFNKKFIGGSTVAAGDILDDAANPANNKNAEIVVGSGPGMRDTVLVFNSNQLIFSPNAPTTPTTP